MTADVKTGASLVVERAQTLHRANTRRLEGHVLPDNLGNVDALAHLIDVTALNQPRHRPSLVSHRDLPHSDANAVEKTQEHRRSWSAVAD